MTHWIPIPPWLYQNDLPDHELQAVYVREAEKKVRQVVARRQALQAQLAEAMETEARAVVFLAEARERLAAYRGAAAARRARIVPVGRRALPHP